MLRWLKTVVVSDVEKASLEASGGDQEGECKRIADDVSKTYSDGIKTGGADMAPGQIWRIPVYWPGGARHGGDASLICCFRVERGKAGPDSCAPARVEKGSVPSGRNREGPSTGAGLVGGPARSSDEVPVMGAERRGRVIRGCSFDQPGVALGGVAWAS
jgi:hypothetical protein